VLASANSSASVPSRTLTSFSGVGIPNITASASSSAQGALGPAFPTDPNPEQGLFEILDLSNTGQNPVNVNFSVTLHINQFLQTDSAGLSADSEVLFLLKLSRFSPTLS
jgi:hypothetical protein